MFLLCRRGSGVKPNGVRREDRIRSGNGCKDGSRGAAGGMEMNGCGVGTEMLSKPLEVCIFVYNTEYIIHIYS